MSLSQLSSWNQIGRWDRFVLDASSNVSVCTMPHSLGNRSLYDVINAMVAKIEATDLKDRAKNVDKIECLGRVLQLRVRRYDASRCRLYHFFMIWWFKQDVHEALTKFNALSKLARQHFLTLPQDAPASVELRPPSPPPPPVIKLNQREILPALQGAQIPVDKTHLLLPLFEAPFYLNGSEEEKLRYISTFIHLLPLAQFLNISVDTILVTISSIQVPPSHTDEERAGFLYGSAVDLVERGKGLKWDSDWKTIIKLIYDSGLNQYVYHGTTEVSYESMLKHGLGSSTRDYSREELLAFRTKSFNPETLSAFESGYYVAGKSTTAFIYGINAPEWLSFIRNQKRKSSVKKIKQGEIVARYDGRTHFVIIQIRTTNSPGFEREQKTFRSLPSPSSYETQSFTQDATCAFFDNVKASRLTVAEVVAFRIPKLQSLLDKN